MAKNKSSKRASMNGAVNVRGQDDGCCSKFFLKHVLVVFNVIFLLSGLAVLAVGLWTVLDKHEYVSLLTSALYAVSTFLLLASGALIIVVGTLGCCSALKEIRIGLMIYATVLLLVFLLEAVSGILAYMYHTTVHQELERTLNHTMLHNYNLDKDKTEAIDNLQKQFECCGAGSFLDWQDSVYVLSNQSQGALTPDSCCKSVSVSCAVSDHPSNIYYQGCVNKFEYYLKEHLIILGAVGLGLCCLQIFGIVFACCLAKSIKEYADRQTQQTNFY